MTHTYQNTSSSEYNVFNDARLEGVPHLQMRSDASPRKIEMDLNKFKGTS